MTSRACGRRGDARRWINLWTTWRPVDNALVDPQPRRARNLGACGTLWMTGDEADAAADLRDDGGSSTIHSPYYYY